MKTPIDLNKSQRVRLTPEAVAQGIFPSIAVGFHREYRSRARVLNPVGTTWPYVRTVNINHSRACKRSLARVQWDNVSAMRHVRPEHLEVIE